MSVTATRWAHVALARPDCPLSREARSVVLVLAGDAHATPGEAFTAAATIGAITGRTERNVLRLFPEIAAWLPHRARPGKSIVWSFPPAPLSRVTGVQTFVDTANLSTPLSPVTGVALSTPLSPVTGTPVTGDRGRDLRDVTRDTRRDPARAPAAAADDVDDDGLADQRDAREMFRRVVGP